MQRQSMLVVFGLVFSTSCVPQPMNLTASRTSQPIADAQPLLRKLDLTVSPDDTAPPTAAALAFARSDFDGAPPFLAAMRSDEDARRATDCLTQAVYYEARSEPVDGQRAVAQVVLNRVRDRAFPHSVCGVVFQGSERRTGCQFSFTCDGSMNRPLQLAAWGRARIVAQAALGGSVYAPVGSATHYHANYVSPWWAPSLMRIGAVGSHIFYRWRDALERALAFRQDYSGSEPGVAAATAVVASGARNAGVLVHYASGSAGSGPGGGVAATPLAAVATEGSVMIHRGPATATDSPRRMTAVAGVHVHMGSPDHAPSSEAGDGTMASGSAAGDGTT
ncbi:cell wall hydrolase [Sphingomonas bacterium]|uniref:cell wall hydrolase n=1 Tax=Sphingomonas bacterium TaxID=1895847 RepID=UPI0020C5BB50|nr:cell wall hydrolase [Sphingomonas bacterium]